MLTKPLLLLIIIVITTIINKYTKLFITILLSKVNLLFYGFIMYFLNKNDIQRFSNPAIISVVHQNFALLNFFIQLYGCSRHKNVYLAKKT